MTVNHEAYEAAAADPDVLARIRSRLIVGDDPEGCWGWGGWHCANVAQRSRGLRGYGMVDVRHAGKSRKLRVHRVLWQALNPGVHPDELDHMCGRGAEGCVRPAHLRPVTGSENQRHRSGAQANNTSGVRGVTQSYGRWYAQLGVLGRHVHLGSYEDRDAAELAARVGRFFAFPSSLKDAHTTADEVERVYSMATPTVRRNLNILKAEATVHRHLDDLKEANIRASV